MTSAPLPPVSDSQLIWTGGNNGNVWDTNLTANWHSNPYWSNDPTIVNFTSGSTVLFDLTGTNTVPVVLSGTLSPGQVTVNSPTDYNFAGAGKLSGTTRLLKGGHGTLVISNTTSHTGSTLVSEGALQVNGKYSSPCTVQAGGPWGPAQASGTGLFSGGIIFQAGGGISPGAGPNSPGILKVSNYCSFRGNTTSHFDLSNDPTGTLALNDQVQVTGNVFLSNTNNTLVFHRVGSAIASGTYKLITCTGTLSGSVSTLKASGLDGIPYSLGVYPGAGGQITLEVRPTRAPGSVIWSGSGGSVWDLATTTNWSNGGAQDYFVGYDSVQFDDSGAANSTITLNDSMPIGTVTVTGTAHYTFQGAGAISGTGGLVKSGTGTLSLFTLNTYTGSTVVTGGVLEVNRIANGGLASSIGAASSDPANLVLYNGCTLRLAGLASVSGDRGITLNSGTCAIDVPNASSDLAFLGNCVGAGALLKTGSGMLVLRTDIGGEANNSYAGGTSVAGGTLQISDDSNLGAAGTPVTLSNGATLDIQWAINFVSRPLMLQTGGGTLNARTSATLNSITGTGRLTLDGALRGVFTMSGTNSYSGGTTIVDGAAWVSKPTAMGTGSVTVSDGAELRFVPGGTSFANNISIAGDGVATQSTSAALFINGTSTTLSGTLTVAGDASITCANTSGLNFTFNGPIALGSKTLSFVPGLANPSNTVKWTVNGVIGGTGDVIWNTISPGATLVLTAANTFTGDTFISGSAGLVVSNTLALQSSYLHYNNGSLQFGNGIRSAVLGALSGTRNLSLVNTSGSAVSLSVGNNNLSSTFDGVLSQAGGLVKVGTGTLTLTATSTYTGATTVSSGVLTVAGAITSSSALNVASGATLNLAGGSVTATTGTIAASGTLCGYGTIGGPLTNNGFVRVDGTMTISGALVNSGTISVPYGTTLVLNGPVTNSGLVDATSGGTVVANSTWSGNPVQSSPPPVTYTTSSAGLWTTAAWSPSQPVSGIGNTIVFNNTVAISSTNDLGSLRLNKLSLSNQAVTLAGSALQFSGSNPSLVASNNYAHRISNNLILDQDTSFVISSSSNATLSGTIQGAGTLIKSGSGTLILTATNTYSGGTVIAGGTVSITSASNLGASGADLTISNGAALKVSTNSVTLNSSDIYLQSGGGSVVNSSALTLNGIISGSGGLTKTSSGILTFSGTVPNTYTGATVINGPVYYGASGAFGTGAVTISSGNQLTFRPNGGTLSNSLNIAGTGGGTGVLYLNGGTDVTLSGTVSLSAASTIGGANSAGMDLTMKTINLNSYALTVKMGAAAGTTSQNWSLQGPISGTGGLTITCGAVSGTPSNTMTISGSNSFSGVTTLGSPAFGTLTLNINSVNALMNSTLDTGTNGAQNVAFTLSGSNTYNLGGLRGSNDLAIGANTLSIGSNGASTTFSGMVTGIGGITKVGTGALTLSGSQLNTGTTTVSQGALYLNGSSISPLFAVQSSGTLRGSGTISGALQIQGCLAPGNASSSGTLTANSVAFLAGGAYNVQLNGATGTANAVQVSGNLSLDPAAVLNATYSGTSAPTAGSKYVIATYQGTWNGVPFAGMADDTTITISGYSFVINYNDAGAVTLTAPSGGMSPMSLKSTATSTSTSPVRFGSAFSGSHGKAPRRSADSLGAGGRDSNEFAPRSNPTQSISEPLMFTKGHSFAGENVTTITFAARSGAVFQAFGTQQVAVVDGLVYTVEGSLDRIHWDDIAVEQLSPERSLELQESFAPSLPTLDLGWSWYSFRIQEGVRGGELRLRISEQ